MQENSNENNSQHYLDSQNNEAQSQEEERIEDGHNFDQMGAMNRYPENININDPESNQNPLSNLMFNKDQNVVEEKSNKFLSFLDKYKESFGKYFNVEVSDIKQKLKGSLIPFNKSFYESIEINADLYGPFWIFTTIIFLIALIGISLHIFIPKIKLNSFMIIIMCLMRFLLFMDSALELLLFFG